MQSLRSRSTALFGAARRGMRTEAYMKSPESFQKVLDTFKARRACAVLRTPTAEAAPKAMQASIDGGFGIVEFTLTTPGCLDCVSDFRAKYDGKVMVGCGTVMDIPDAKAAMDAGAEFLVAPVLVPEVVTWAAMNNIVIIPGCQTPTEAYMAYKAGAPVQKIFPGVAGGHMWVKAVSAALPMLTLNPTSGVDLDNAGDFLKNGASSIGLVAPLFPPDAIAGEKWDVIQANAEKVIGNVKASGMTA
jgi:2-dehydro-3-deoxyphosphogluconate aldolase/(4S)-4-hydroxy-2-oxoglutarate aldolase